MGALDELDRTAYDRVSLCDQDFGVDLTSISLNTDISMASWTELVQSDAQIQMDDSYINYANGTHFGSTSSELSQSSLGSLPALQTTTSDGLSAYQCPVEPFLNDSQPYSMSTFHQILNDTKNYGESAHPISSNGSPSAQEYPFPEYQTAKERSILHRRKQNRAAQRTFRQRKELERIELQVRLEAAMKQTGDLQKACEVLNVAVDDLRSRVKSLESENACLKEQYKRRARTNFEEDERVLYGDVKEIYE